MGRWPNEDLYAGLATDAASRYGVPASLVLAIMAVETGGAFNPTAIRQEVKIGDASRGLMQILYRTAKAEGYSGAPDGLFDPATNIEYGTKYLAEQYGKAGSIMGAASGYNGGWAPSRGMGMPADHAFLVVLARDQKTGDPIRTRQVKPGEYANQPYVDAVVDAYNYFEQKRQQANVITQTFTPTPQSGAANPKLIGILVGILLALLGLAGRRR